MGASFSKWARWEDPGLQAMSVVSGAGSSQEIETSVVVSQSAGAAQDSETSLTISHTAKAAQETGTSVSMFQGAQNLTINGGNFSVTNVSADDKTRLEKLLDFLSEVNFRAIHLENLEKLAPGTVKWFLESDIFRHWLLSQWAIIWGTGMPGAGKTILASMVTDYLNSLADASSDICVAFIYCRYTEPMTVRDILAAVVRQLVERYPQLLPMVEPMCTKHQLHKTKPTQKELIGLIRDICAIFRVAYISIDGLDEALPDEQFDLVDALTSIKANFIITSRPLHILEEVLPSASFFDIVAREEDVELFVAQRIERSPELRRLLGDNKKRREVITEVCKASQGMFLHATLLIENIRYCTSVKKIMERLGQLPAGLDALYAETFRRIESQPAERAALAKRVLFWLVYTQEPLPIEDLKYAVAEDPENDWLDPSSLVDESLLVSVCFGLVLVEEHIRPQHFFSFLGEPLMRGPRLIHYTARDSLRRLLNSCEPGPHTILAETCITRLIACGIPNLGHPSDSTDYPPLRSRRPVLEEILSKPLLRYAYKRWAFHALEAIGGSICHHSRPLLLIRHLFEISKAFPVEVGTSRVRYSDDLKSPLHFVAVYGLLPLLPLAADHPNDQTAQGRTALMLAVEEGNVTMVEALLSLEGIDPYVEDAEFNTPLSLAALKGSSGVLRQLLQHPKMQVNRANQHGNTALLSLCLEPSANLGIAMQMLDAPGIDPNLRNDEGLTAFMTVARRGAIPFLDLLAEHPALDINGLDYSGRTAFLHACLYADSEVLQWFMRLPGVDLTIKDYQGCNALMLRAGKPNDACSSSCNPVGAYLAEFTALIGRGAALDLNERDFKGQTALFHALQYNNRAVAALIQLEGLDFTLRDYRGRTPLMVARDEWSIRYLLTHPDTDVNARDNEGNTAVLAASISAVGGTIMQRSGGSASILRALLTSGVGANPRDARGLSNVQWVLMVAVLETASKILTITTWDLTSARQECYDGRQILLVSPFFARLQLHKVPGIRIHLESAPTTNGKAQHSSLRIAVEWDTPTEAGSGVRGPLPPIMCFDVWDYRLSVYGTIAFRWTGSP